MKTRAQYEESIRQDEKLAELKGLVEKIPEATEEVNHVFRHLYFSNNLTQETGGQVLDKFEAKMKVLEEALFYQMKNLLQHQKQVLTDIQRSYEEKRKAADDKMFAELAVFTANTQVFESSNSGRSSPTSHSEEKKSTSDNDSSPKSLSDTNHEESIEDMIKTLSEECLTSSNWAFEEFHRKSADLYNQMDREDFHETYSPSFFLNEPKASDYETELYQNVDYNFDLKF